MKSSASLSPPSSSKNNSSNGGGSQHDLQLPQLHTTTTTTTVSSPGSSQKGPLLAPFSVETSCESSVNNSPHGGSPRACHAVHQGLASRPYVVASLPQGAPQDVRGGGGAVAGGHQEQRYYLPNVYVEACSPLAIVAPDDELSLTAPSLQTPPAPKAARDNMGAALRSADYHHPVIVSEECEEEEPYAPQSIVSSATTVLSSKESNESGNQPVPPSYSPPAVQASLPMWHSASNNHHRELHNDNDEQSAVMAAGGIGEAFAAADTATDSNSSSSVIHQRQNQSGTGDGEHRLLPRAPSEGNATGRYQRGQQHLGAHMSSLQIKQVASNGSFSASPSSGRSLSSRSRSPSSVVRVRIAGGSSNTHMHHSKQRSRKQRKKGSSNNNKLSHQSSSCSAKKISSSSTMKTGSTTASSSVGPGPMIARLGEPLVFNTSSLANDGEEEEDGDDSVSRAMYNVVRSSGHHTSTNGAEFSLPESVLSKTGTGLDVVKGSWSLASVNAAANAAAGAAGESPDSYATATDSGASSGTVTPQMRRANGKEDTIAPLAVVPGDFEVHVNVMLPRPQGKAHNHHALSSPPIPSSFSCSPRTRSPEGGTTSNGHHAHYHLNHQLPQSLYPPPTAAAQRGGEEGDASPGVGQRRGDPTSPSSTVITPTSDVAMSSHHSSSHVITRSSSMYDKKQHDAVMAGGLPTWTSQQQRGGEGEHHYHRVPPTTHTHHPPKLLQPPDTERSDSLGQTKEKPFPLSAHNNPLSASGPEREMPTPHHASTRAEPNAPTPSFAGGSETMVMPTILQPLVTADGNGSCSAHDSFNLLPDDDDQAPPLPHAQLVQPRMLPITSRGVNCAPLCHNLRAFGGGGGGLYSGQCSSNSSLSMLLQAAGGQSGATNGVHHHHHDVGSVSSPNLLSVAIDLESCVATGSDPAMSAHPNNNYLRGQRVTKVPASNFVPQSGSNISSPVRVGQHQLLYPRPGSTTSAPPLSCLTSPRSNLSSLHQTPKSSAANIIRSFGQPTSQRVQQDEWRVEDSCAQLSGACSAPQQSFDVE